MATKSKKQTKLIFSPEALAYILLQVEYIPGMNNSTDYRREGMDALMLLEEERARKQEEASSTKEMRPVLKRKATLQEQLEGKGDEYTYVPHGIGLSGADPLASFFVGNAVLNLPLRWLGKEALYGLGRYGTSTLKNWARRKIIGLEMSSPTLTLTPKLASSNNFLGPNSWLQDWNEQSGPLITLGNKAVKRNYLKAKKDLYDYIYGSEFKQRVMNTGRFTDLDYKDLIKEIERELLRTKYVGLDLRPGAGGGNTMTYFERNNMIDDVDNFEIILAPSMSLILHRANAWHELWHSIAGKNIQFSPKKFPLLYKLQLFNIDANPMYFSKAIARASDRQTLLDYLRKEYPDFVKEWDLGKENFLSEELRRSQGLLSPSISNPSEIRSRMHATLDFLRLKGYNTLELVKNPDKFIKWINELYLLQANIPWDLQLLLSIYNINDLANYASKVLSVTGAAYTGSSLVNNSNSKLNNVSNQTNHR